MKASTTQSFSWRRQYSGSVAVFALAVLVLPLALSAQGPGTQDKPVFKAGDLVVSRSVYDNNSANVTVGEILPPNCLPKYCSASTGAVNDGTYPYVFNNDTYDASFGITARIYLDEINPSGTVVNTLEVPNSLMSGITGTSDQLVTSFSSKSELGLHLSTDGQYLTFMGYVAPVDTLDVSNSNTYGTTEYDPTNPVTSRYYRAAARVDSYGQFDFTETNAYSGNNGRSAILNNSNGNDFFYTAGNAGNGGKNQPAGVVLGAGAQFFYLANQPESAQDPGDPTPVASFSVTELGFSGDKVGKDDNFRGIAVFNNVLYYTKGSGGNGSNTVYYVNTSDTPCAGGIGLPSPGATLPTGPLAGFDPSTGLPTNMCILAGFPATSNKEVNPVNYPFGIWFADANTLYVADEGDGYAGGTDLYTHAAAQTLAGLEKWVFDPSSQMWKLAYTLTNGLDLGTPYTVSGYPTGINSGTGLPWSPATDGLRNLTGKVNGDGTVTIWAVTSTVSGNGDTGADPDKLVVIKDRLANTSAAGVADEKFSTVRTAGFGELFRGVSFTPGTDLSHTGDY